MEVMTILTIVVLNIILPTADVVTDVRLAVKLYNPPAFCVRYSWSDILRDGERFPTLQCQKDPLTFCSRNGNSQHCVLSHPRLATALIIPFLLNYIVCFYTFFRLTRDHKKYLFIFPLLNLYPQYGKTRIL